MAGTQSNAIVRELVATSTKKTSKAEFNGYNLTFTVEDTQGVIKKVEVSGSKSVGTPPGHISFQGSVNENGSVSFNPMSSDISTENIAIIIGEMLAIKGSAPVEVEE